MPFPCLSLPSSWDYRIGFAIARRLAQDRAHVVVSSRKQQNVDQAVATLQGEGLSVTGTVCHVGKAEDRERLVAMTLDINVKAPALMTKAVVPEMEKRGGGSVVIVSSIAAFSPSPGFSPYNVSKTALLGLNNTLAIELAPRNIRVNCLHLDLSRLASAGCSGWTRKKRKA
ncbi:dehydrogenase/reductase SDR family member 4-like 2 isoform 2 [Homo sapiens]|uniref:dehydrogenase/reductase SDR family member 4-like 2 isoform 2 n=1 Tax=Homo sapiens TaxID=9606 RepID=UPI0001DD3805|nr:dehydrogenase/reductase SDR family member 4-like 2 isoform 2 [Homo sapiens]|eukprot:NP_001180564.1 dehydrogenase/reductase SDR family member 4-like 2 isoform 2 [Homo sapiens]